MFQLGRLLYTRVYIIASSLKIGLFGPVSVLVVPSFRSRKLRSSIQCIKTYGHIEQLYSLISYNCVIQLENGIALILCGQYQANDVVCWWLLVLLGSISPTTTSMQFVRENSPSVFLRSILLWDVILPG